MAQMPTAQETLNEMRTVIKDNFDMRQIAEIERIAEIIRKLSATDLGVVALGLVGAEVQALIDEQEQRA